MSAPNYSTETIDRIKKLERIRSLGVNPFATRFNVSSPIAQITTQYTSNINIENGDTNPFRSVEEVIADPKSDIRIAGRVILHRSF